MLFFTPTTIAPALKITPANQVRAEDVLLSSGIGDNSVLLTAADATFTLTAVERIRAVIPINSNFLQLFSISIKLSLG